MSGKSALDRIATWTWPETGSALERAEAMVEPAILAGAFGDSRTLAVCGLQYHLGGEEDTRQLAEQAGITAADHVLDVACFLGGPALQLAETYACQITGVDLSPLAIAGARRIAQLAGLEHLLRYEVADAAHMPYPDGAFSVIWNQGSLNHDPAWLEEFDRVLRPGGRLALVFEHRPAQGPRREGDSRWTIAETAARVAASGYEIRHLDDLTEREIALGWQRMIRRLDERREVYLAAKGAEWIEAARKEFIEEIAAMRRLEWSNARLIAIKPDEGSG
ncbi:MAG: methyltransferase domain-containing protein [Anaerolineae bacterium]